jgi:hypothetical protein
MPRARTHKVGARSEPDIPQTTRWGQVRVRGAGLLRRRNRALCSARKMSRHFARLNTSSRIKPPDPPGFVNRNSSAVTDVMIRL